MEPTPEYTFPNCSDEVILLMAQVVREYRREGDRKYRPVLQAAEKALQRQERRFRAARAVYES